MNPQPAQGTWYSSTLHDPGSPCQLKREYHLGAFDKMKVLQRLLSLLSFGAPLVLANPNCPIYGAEFPKPQRLTDSAIWKTAMENLKTTFDDLDQKAVNYSFTVQLFSTNPGPPVLFERFHTAQNLPSNTTGVKKVDIDTVFRLGSVTKIYTVLAFLAETGDKYFNHPITEFVPELQDIVNRRGDGPVDELRSVKWEDITIEALLSQVRNLRGQLSRNAVLTLAFVDVWD